MNWREFAASIIGSFAWPIAAGVLVWVLREHVKTLLHRQPTRLKAGPFEAEWAETSEDIGANVVALAAKAPNDDMTEDHRFSEEIAQLTELAEKAPVVAVGTGFRLVERVIRGIASDAGVDDPITTPLSRLLPLLADERLISPETAGAVHGLYYLRTIAAHDDGSGLSVTPERAREYVALVEAVLSGLSRPKHAVR
jgi:hypothetical protein